MEKHKQLVKKIHHHIVKKIQGFTIVELIVVIVIIGILSAIGVVGYGEIIKKVAVSQVKNDLLGAAAAMEKYNSYKSIYPDALPSDFKYGSDTQITVFSFRGGKDYCVEATDAKRSSVGVFSICSIGSNDSIAKIYEGSSAQNLASNNAFFWNGTSVGYSNSCAIAFDGKVYCWGYNNSGQIGNGNTGTNQKVPVAVSAGAMPAGAVKSITAGQNHACAIASDDKVYCWGGNGGRLGNGDTTSSNIPVAVSAGAMPAGAVKSITAGQWHTCAIASDDKVYCWGGNTNSQLGNGNTTTPQTTPVAVLTGAMPVGAVKSIVSEYSHTCAIASDDKVYCWGYNVAGQLGNGNTGTNQNVPVAVSAGAMPVGAVKSIAVGYSHTCAIASDNNAYCWGRNAYGQLGNGTTATAQNIPVAVLAGAMPVGAVKSIDVGYEHTCAIASDDKVYCWGYNYQGQLGNGGIGGSKYTPVAVSASAMPTGAIKSINAGYYHNCAIASDDKIYCWGKNDYGELGNGYVGIAQKIAVAALSGAMPAGAIKSISANYYTGCAIASDDKAYCWGYNYYGQLGNGNSGALADQNAPVAVSAGAMPAGAIKSISAGYFFNCAIASNDRPYCWGYNFAGQLGNGNSGTDQNVPVAVLAGAMPAGAIKSITTGRDHTCAIASDSKVYCWGYNAYGQTGNGVTGGNYSVPVAISAGAMPVGAVKSISAGSEYTCAIASDDKVYCWGYNNYGQLGNGNTGTNQNIPVAVLAGAMPAGAVKSINAGYDHTCAIASDNKAYCWGYNAWGQLGYGSASNIPVAVSAGVMPVGAVKSIVAGMSHTCAIASDDKVYCWGENQYGGLGNGNTTNTSNPVAVLDGAMPVGAVKSIAAGYKYTCAIASDNKVYCWGFNDTGQLGSYVSSGLINRVPGLVLPPQ